ncbi:MAG: RdgB/HAM1 family non-canonical purine NTP pyrophosphatase [Alphaproteobacteria bacterium]|nr:RdgB/HAM1 family non-canonical purine NTP pyrophosphatase [Alphaproteobacteria bacterium]
MAPETPSRRFSGKRLIVASHNPGKVREIGALIEPYGITPVSAGELGLAEPEETGLTFIANAELKAHAAAEASGEPTLADDSGLAVDALGGDPGIYSARWAGPAKDFALAMRKVNDGLKAAGADAPASRGAHFVCALSLAWPDGHVESFEGKVFGTLVWPPRGDQGFGYDPIFQANGQDITFGEMASEAKHAMSHRADAFAQLMVAVFTK